jgi:hypothetical protein
MVSTGQTGNPSLLYLFLIFGLLILYEGGGDDDDCHTDL